MRRIPTSTPIPHALKWNSAVRNRESTRINANFRMGRKKIGELINLLFSARCSRAQSRLAFHSRHFASIRGSIASLRLSETEKGRLWRVIYTGETSPDRARRSVAVASQVPAPIGANTPGGRFYLQVCAACHMPNGSGVPAMQPALAGSAVVAGDTTRLINVLLQGPAAVLPPDREKFSNLMPPFAVLGDADLASVINYLRANFAPGAPAVTPAQIAAQRGK